MKPYPSIVVVSTLLLFCSGLSGCNRAAAANGDLQLTGSKYCAAFRTSAVTTSPGGLGDPAGTFDDCIHRWGYTLAPARDPADVVAQATVNACSSILTSWSQQLEAQGGPPQSDGDQEQLTPAQQQIRMAEARALFYVVQARAGGCAPPPANTLLNANGTAAG